MHTVIGIHMSQDQYSPEKKGLISGDLKSLLFSWLTLTSLSYLRTKHRCNKDLSSKITLGMA